MKKPEAGSDNPTNNNYLNRRKILKAFGLTALSGTAVSAFSMDRSKTVDGKSITQHIYASVNDMKQDTMLKDGVLVRTAGYYTIGDGGDAEYMISRNKPEEEIGVILLNNKLYAVLVNVSGVNYQMFGAVGDGINDDGVQIKLAHTYANRENIPVINQSGEYWIKGTNSIEILTNVQWGHSVFHIDEKLNTTRANRFIVNSREKPVVIKFDRAAKSKIIDGVKPGVTLVPEFAPYKNSLIVVTDDNDRIGARGGDAYKGRVARPREEFFL